MRRFRRFRHSEAGAVTVEWVVLTAGVVGLAAGVSAYISGTVQDTLLQRLGEVITGAFDDAN